MDRGIRPMGCLVCMMGFAVSVAAAEGGATLTDPTRPVDYIPDTQMTQPLPGEMVDWRLAAVRISADDRTAVLNGRLVRVGDNIGGAKVLEIRPGAVVVERDRKQLEVLLHGATFKKPASQQSGNTEPR